MDVNVVIVEDDPTNALVLKMILAKMGGHEVTVTESVETVQSLIRAGRVDVVIMDISLTNTLHEGRRIDGVEFTRILLADERCRGTPVILTTAHAMKGDAERLMRESGAAGYVSKPISDLRAFVGQVETCARLARQP